MCWTLFISITRIKDQALRVGYTGSNDRGLYIVRLSSHDIFYFLLYKYYDIFYIFILIHFFVALILTQSRQWVQFIFLVNWHHTLIQPFLRPRLTLLEFPSASCSAPKSLSFVIFLTHEHNSLNCGRRDNLHIL